VTRALMLLVFVSVNAPAAPKTPRAKPRITPAPTAQPAPAPTAPTGERPWAHGIPTERQERALSLYRTGNLAFEQSQYSQALGNYREALKSWDHPAIRYNTAVALINLDQPLEAFENLESALRFGAAPFDADAFKQAQLYKKLLASLVSEIEVVCDEPGAEVMLDGERLFTGPGTAHRRLRPGPHQLVAHKEGFVTETSAPSLEPGHVQREVLTLHVATAPVVKLVRRWPVGVPWAVLVGGAVVGGLSAVFFATSQSSYDTFDKDLALLCPSGCARSALPSTVQRTQSQARTLNGFGIGLAAVGGAALVAGVVLLSQNTLHPEEAAGVTWLPVLAPGFAGVTASLRF
jgi:hypothetical protein